MTKGESVLTVELLRCNRVVIARDLFSSFCTEFLLRRDLTLDAGEGGKGEVAFCDVSLFTDSLAVVDREKKSPFLPWSDKDSDKEGLDASKGGVI